MQAKCRQHAGPHQEKLCDTCDHKTYVPDPYVDSLWRIHLLQTAGLAFAPQDFDLDWWLDLGIFKQRLGALRPGL